MSHEQEYHEMVLESREPTGEEIWCCPTCGRRFLLQWPPEYKKIIIEAGDENAIHSGGKAPANLPVQPAPIEKWMAAEDQGVIPAVDPATLQPWMAWCDQVDMESLWSAVEEADPETLRPWKEWLDKENFDNLWNRSQG